MSKRVIDMTMDELGDLIEARTRSKPTAESRGWLSGPKVCKKYNIGRKRYKAMCESGQLPAEVRPTQGGVGWFVRPDDAERVLGDKPALRVVG